MTLTKAAIFSSIIVIVLLGLQYLPAKYGLPIDKMVMSDTKEIVKCVTNQIQTAKHGAQSQVKGLVDLQNIPEVKFLSAGDKFMYKCCGKEKAVYQFGFYKHGTPFPNPLVCRVNVKKGGSCSVLWATDLNASSYSNRISVEYHKSTSCVLWSIRNVRKTDENSYVAFLRDNFDRRQTFKACPPVSVNVTTEPLQQVTTEQPGHASDKPTKSTKTQNPSQTITQEYKPTKTRQAKRGSKYQNTVIIIAACLILGLLTGSCIWERKIIIRKIRKVFQAKYGHGNVTLSEQSTTRDSS